MKTRDIIAEIEKFAPQSYQEDYDNSGLLTGDPGTDCLGVLFSLDCTEEIVDEAINNKCNLIVAHHPILFSGLKRITGSNYVQRTIIKAIKNDIAIYACHTNIDHVENGVNKKIAEKLGLSDTRILLPKAGLMRKLVTFVPKSHHQQVLDALFAVGAGAIGNYDSCSFNSEGEGTFRGNDSTKPFVGEPGKLSREPEVKVETVFLTHQEKEVIKALRGSHPYEEIAYDIYALQNHHDRVGSGMTGLLPAEMDESSFMDLVKKQFGVKMIRHTALTGKKIKKVAVCGGSGRFLLKNAIAAGADVFITADFKYHEFFDVEGRLLLLDIGHYESEQFTPEIFYEIIKKKFATFAIRLSKINTNPINYF